MKTIFIALFGAGLLIAAPAKAQDQRPPPAPVSPGFTTGDWGVSRRVERREARRDWRHRDRYNRYQTRRNDLNQRYQHRQ